MNTQNLLKIYKKAFRDIYNMLIKHASAEEPGWDELIKEYANIVEDVKGTEVEKFVANLGIEVINELERCWKTVSEKGGAN